MRPESPEAVPAGGPRRPGSAPRSLFPVLGLAALLAAGVWFYTRQGPPPAPQPEQTAEAPPPADTAPVATPGAVGSPESLADIEREAREYVQEITRPEALAASDADKFVRREQLITLAPKQPVERLALAELLNDPTLGDSTPITVVERVEQVEMTSTRGLAAEAGLDLARRFRLREGGQVRETTTGELLERYTREPEARVDVVDSQGNAMDTRVEDLLREAGMEPERRIVVLENEQPAERAVGDVLRGSTGVAVPVIRTVEQFSVTTKAELRADPARTPDEAVEILREPRGLAEITVGELMMDAPPAAIEEGGPAEQSIYYVRTVRAGDDQGIWGIVHHGLVENFARGVALHRGDSLETYRVDIPRDADELLASRRSSFLGRMIHDKTTQSHVYNFEQGRLGRNPDMIRPGQEIIIVKFPEEELIEIYKHFASQAQP